MAAGSHDDLHPVHKEILGMCRRNVIVKFSVVGAVRLHRERSDAELHAICRYGKRCKGRKRVARRIIQYRRVRYDTCLRRSGINPFVDQLQFPFGEKIPAERHHRSIVRMIVIIVGLLRRIDLFPQKTFSDAR